MWTGLYCLRTESKESPCEHEIKVWFKQISKYLHCMRSFYRTGWSRAEFPELVFRELPTASKIFNCSVSILRAEVFRACTNKHVLSSSAFFSSQIHSTFCMIYKDFFFLWAYNKKPASTLILLSSLHVPAILVCIVFFGHSLRRLSMYVMCTAIYLSLPVLTSWGCNSRPNFTFISVIILKIF